MKKLFIILGIFIIIFIAVLFIYQSKQTIYSKGETVEFEEVSYVVEDYYYGDYPVIDQSTLTFDKYLCVDLKITNLSDVEKNINTYSTFKVMDDSDQIRRVTMDENNKKFSVVLKPGEEFNITLVFPVVESSSYTLVYRSTRKEENEHDIVWELPNEDLETKVVPTTVEHNDIEEKASEKKDNFSLGGKDEEENI